MTTRHAVTNVVLPRGERHRIAARYVLILFRSDDESRPTLPKFVANIEDEWVESDGRRKIAQKTSTPAFSSN